MRYVGVAALGALLCLSPPARADILINVSKAQQQLTVTVNGIETYRWPVSTGKPGYDTPSGSFHAFRLEEVYFSKKYDDAPMPDAVFFHGGYAVHGTYEQSKLGRAVSHGCVRLSRAHAATLFALVRRQGPSRTHVVVSNDRLVSRLPDPGTDVAEWPRMPEKRRANIKADRKTASRKQVKQTPRTTFKPELKIEAKAERKPAPELAVQPDPMPAPQEQKPLQEQRTVARAIEPLPDVKPDSGFREFGTPIDVSVATPDVTGQHQPKPPHDVVGLEKQKEEPNRKGTAHRAPPETRRVAQRGRADVRRADPGEARMRALYRKYGFKWEP